MAHPDYLCTMLTAQQIAEWRAFTAIRPWGERAADFRAAMQAAIAVNVHRGRGKQARELSDFLLADDERMHAEMQHIDDPHASLARVFGGF